MKCQYCGGNLGLESEVCPFCGRENPKAEKYISTKKSYQKAFDETEKIVKKKVKLNARTGRLLFIALMAVVVLVMTTVDSQYDDAATRIKNREKKIDRFVDKNIDSMLAKVQEMERNREYLAMEYYVLNYRLRGREEFSDYTRVFTAAISYEDVFAHILNIASGFDYYGNKGAVDWCNELAYSITSWNQYVGGAFWHDASDSPMHLNEHGAFMADCRAAVQDMVQVYFKLTDQQADAMWSMKKEALGELLYEQYQTMNSEVSANE